MAILWSTTENIWFGVWGVDGDGKGTSMGDGPKVSKGLWVTWAEKDFLTDLWRKTCDKNKRMCFFLNGIISGWFQKYGYIPQNWWFIIENRIKMDDLGVPLFLETSIYHGSC